MKITKQDLQALRIDLDELLDAFNKNSKFTLKLGNASYSDAEATFQLKLTADGEMTIEQTNVELFTDFKYGDKVKLSDGKIFIITGYIPRRPKSPICIEDENGGRYKCSKNHLNNAEFVSSIIK
tara:strand:+ start:349 stop:720 length:372 start_codon:yes stop_codon:yes gene_type:complete